MIASQNPHEYEGVYPLLESQLDRFLIRLLLDYPDQQTEIAILKRYDHPGGGHNNALDSIQALPAGLIAEAQAEAVAVHVAQSLYQYVSAIAAASRQHPQLSLGLSSRGALAIMRCARVNAAMQNRAFVTPDDVKNVAAKVVCHRLLLDFRSYAGRCISCRYLSGYCQSDQGATKCGERLMSFVLAHFIMRRFDRCSGHCGCLEWVAPGRALALVGCTINFIYRLGALAVKSTI